MGRKPIGKKAMTATQRQQRRRRRLRVQRSAEIAEKERTRARDKAAQTYIPTPAGITYWHKITIRDDAGEREIWAPRTKPLATCESNLDADDVLALIDQLTTIAESRGLVSRK
jgi:hypothetical protein